MKTIVPILFCVFLILSTACKKKVKAAEVDEDIITEMNEDRKTESNTTEFKTLKDCDEFIDQYEAWTVEYVSLLEKHEGNPVALASSPDYASMTMQAMEWATNWDAKLATSCAANPNYEKRMRQIQENMEKKLKQIGLK